MDGLGLDGEDRQLRENVCRHLLRGPLALSRLEMRGDGPQDGCWNVGPDTPHGPAVAWVVVRDQRGGVTWMRLDLDVKEDAANVPGGGGLAP